MDRLFTLKVREEYVCEHCESNAATTSVSSASSSSSSSLSQDEQHMLLDSTPALVASDSTHEVKSSSSSSAASSPLNHQQDHPKQQWPRGRRRGLVKALEHDTDTLSLNVGLVAAAGSATAGTTAAAIKPQKLSLPARPTATAPAVTAVSANTSTRVVASTTAVTPQAAPPQVAAPFDSVLRSAARKSGDVVTCKASAACRQRGALPCRRTLRRRSSNASGSATALPTALPSASTTIASTTAAPPSPPRDSSHMGSEGALVNATSGAPAVFCLELIQDSLKLDPSANLDLLRIVQPNLNLSQVFEDDDDDDAMPASSSSASTPATAKLSGGRRRQEKGKKAPGKQKNERESEVPQDPTAVPTVSSQLPSTLRCFFGFHAQRHHYVAFCCQAPSSFDVDTDEELEREDVGGSKNSSSHNGNKSSSSSSGSTGSSNSSGSNACSSRRPSTRRYRRRDDPTAGLWFKFDDDQVTCVGRSFQEAAAACAAAGFQPHVLFYDVQHPDQQQPNSPPLSSVLSSTESLVTSPNSTRRLASSPTAAAPTPAPAKSSSKPAATRSAEQNPASPPPTNSTSTSRPVAVNPASRKSGPPQSSKRQTGSGAGTSRRW